MATAEGVLWVFRECLGATPNLPIPLPMANEDLSTPFFWEAKFVKTSSRDLNTLAQIQTHLTTNFLSIFLPFNFIGVFALAHDPYVPPHLTGLL